MSEVILVGAGHHGCGVLEIFRARERAGFESPQVVGFVDDASERHGLTIDGVPVLGDIESLMHRSDRNAALVLAIASCRAKVALEQKLSAEGFVWASAVHPSAIIGRETVVEDGAIVAAGVVVAYETRIGRHTTINLGCTVGHHCEIGDFSTIGPGVNIAGRVHLDPEVEIQTNATIIPDRRLGRGAKVGPGSVVLNDVEEAVSVFGNPARAMPRLKS